MTSNHKDSKDSKDSKGKIPCIKNSFPIYQVKKMIGKKLIVPWSSLIITMRDRNNAKLIKAKIIESLNVITNNKQKNLIMCATCNNGVLQIFKNIDVYLVINSISYKELNEGVGKDINIIIHQYPKMSKSEIKILL